MTAFVLIANDGCLTQHNTHYLNLFLLVLKYSGETRTAHTTMYPLTLTLYE